METKSKAVTGADITELVRDLSLDSRADNDASTPDCAQARRAA